MNNDVVNLILQDHEEMRRLIGQLRADPDSRPSLVPLLTTLVTAHERAEESEVYPPARREALGPEPVEHSQEEHLLADRFMRDLAGHEPDSAGYAEALDNLLEAVEHHLGEEEETLLGPMRDALSERRLDELGVAFLRARQEHLGEQAEDATKDELVRQAKNIGLSVGDRTKAELAAELDKHADE